MAISVAMPSGPTLQEQSLQRQQLRQQKTSNDIDTILKGVNAAIQGYGVYVGAKEHEALQEAAGVKASAEKAAATVAQEEGQGIYRPAAFNKHFVPATEGTPYATQLTLRTPDGDKQIYALQTALVGKAPEGSLTPFQKADLEYKDKALAQQRELEFAKLSRDKNADKVPAPTGFPQGAKLSTTDKQRFDNVKEALESIHGMESALNQGDWTVHPLGDNDFTRNQRIFGEALGRMQSGAAISKTEEARFLAMAPTIGDNSDQQAKKISWLKDQMRSRLQTLGANPDEVEQTFSLPKIGDPGAAMANGAPQWKDMRNMSDADVKAEIDRLKKLRGQK